MKKTFILIVLLTGLFGTPKSFGQTEPYIGQIESVGFNFAPPGWLMCQGQLLPIEQYFDLYTLIGTTYGGDGISTFALPDFRGRTLIGEGQGTNLSQRNLGENAGSAIVTLTVSTLPAHSHPVNASTAAGTTSVPTNNVLANTGTLDKEYAGSSNTVMSATGSSGQSSPTPVSTQQPYIGINYIIAVEGIFPSHP